jgi:hypothetical protein
MDGSPGNLPGWDSEDLVYQGRGGLDGHGRESTRLGDIRGEKGEEWQQFLCLQPATDAADRGGGSQKDHGRGRVEEMSRGSRDMDSESVMQTDIWRLFSKFLSSIPNTDYVTTNNLTHLLGKDSTFKKKLDVRGIASTKTDAPFVPPEDFYTSGGPIEVLPRNSEVPERVHAWTEAPRHMPKKEYMRLVRPWRLQVYIIMTDMNVAAEMVKLTRDAVEMSTDDILYEAMCITGLPAVHPVNGQLHNGHLSLQNGH